MRAQFSAWPGLSNYIISRISDCITFMNIYSIFSMYFKYIYILYLYCLDREIGEREHEYFIFILTVRKEEGTNLRRTDSIDSKY